MHGGGLHRLRGQENILAILAKRKDCMKYWHLKHGVMGLLPVSMLWHLQTEAKAIEVRSPGVLCTVR